MLNEKLLDKWNEKPFPHVNPKGVVLESVLEELRQSLPDLTLFEVHTNKPRPFGQNPHDRMELVYRHDLPVSDQWHQFVNYLLTSDYPDKIKVFLGVGELKVKFHWQVAESGQGLSPHTDSPRKLGTHIFYLNTQQDWDASWGGETTLYDDRQMLDHRTAPEPQDFANQFKMNFLDNHSLLFMRTDHSWHGVAPISAPSGKRRWIFSAVFYPIQHKPSASWRHIFRSRREAQEYFVV